ncbi:putative transcriptional regulator, MarR family protein [Saccharopolyspora subtropica]|uniref:MarR family transcriptional regulator n=1 Tax=Saccharopolyspora thermophila TaxID=89367 RepID=A0A917JLY3_9PSEU|nr:MarR family transcriptional regulator [Saccharopolyspora subtropica]GGI71869.1 putative transcriptional regulator, MarR family protein [Saccharopolyspora subtropica]
MNEVRRTLSQELGVLIKETQSILHQRMDERLRPLGLSVPQYASLQALHDTPGITGSELARRAFVSRQSMNVLLQGLERRGLVERSSEPGPRRERGTVLTAAGEELLIRAREDVAAVAQLMTDQIAPADLTRLRELLTVCRDALLDLRPRRETTRRSHS